MKTSFWTRLFDLIAPRSCAVCGRRLSPNESAICGVCHLHLPFTNFHHHPYDNPMAKLFWGLIPVERAAALFFYEPHSEISHIIYDMKYHGQQELGEAMGRIAARQFAKEDFFRDIDALVPIPITRRRQWKRGYNQSMMIARGISSVTDIPIYNNVVKRTQFAGSQTDKHRWERQKNVENVFRLNRPDEVRGKHLLVVDDIVTTGSTIISCANQLCLAGDVSISIMTLGFTKH